MNEIDEIIDKYFQDMQENLGISEIFFESLTEEETDKIVEWEYRIFKAGFLTANIHR